MSEGAEDGISHVSTATVAIDIESTANCTDQRAWLAHVAWLDVSLDADGIGRFAENARILGVLGLRRATGQCSRAVYMCHVIGAPGVGKTALCRALIADNMTRLMHKDFRSGSQCCINSMQIYGQEKHMAMRDIEVRQPLDPLQPHDMSCDVACLVYDTTDARSFEYVARLFIKYFADNKIPVMIVGTKCDLQEVRQEYLLQPKEFCERYRILAPNLFSLEDNRKELYVKLATMATFP